MTSGLVRLIGRCTDRLGGHRISHASTSQHEAVMTDGKVRDIQMLPSGLYRFGPDEKFKTPRPEGTWVGVTKMDVPTMFRKVKTVHTTGKQALMLTRKPRADGS
jgi:hypothetical protein